MALEKAHTCSKTNVYAANAYHRILSYSGDKDSLVFTVGTYNNSTDRNNGYEPFQSKSFRYNPGVGSTKELITHLYDYLKTLSEYSGALDV